MKLIHGDALEKLRDLPTSTIDCVVTDPPYGLKFMGKAWDVQVPSVDVWREVLRVLKPGGHVLSFGGTRTYHHMAMAIELAGFEVRDMLSWLYGSGFPKSLDVSKAIDKAAGVERPSTPLVRHDGKLQHNKEGGGWKQSSEKYVHHPVFDGSTDDALKWQGWGTALKPANEPIVLARKPLERGLTVAENVLKWGTGALNIDGTRVGTETITQRKVDARAWHGNNFGAKKQQATGETTTTTGRWPANVLFDDDAAAELDEKNNYYGDGVAPSLGPSRFFYVAKASKRERNAGLEGMPEREAPGSKRSTPAEGRSIALGAPRANHHPTVKPIKLMEYLITLVCPPGGIVLDPFMGSGSTGVAATNLGRQFVGIEREADYIEIARRRIEHAQQLEMQLDLDGGA